jgi:hypothetical protein
LILCDKNFLPLSYFNIEKHASWEWRWRCEANLCLML